jgi:Fe-S-cluster-containing dehydrogenase component
MANRLSRRHLLIGSGAAIGAAAVARLGRSQSMATPTDASSPNWGIAVDLGRCASRVGCTACIDACHEVHRVPSSERPTGEPPGGDRHAIAWLWKEPFARVFPEQAHPYQSTVSAALPTLVLCNHCKHPPCTRVCPTGATWRRDDGIVAMDVHRCIGCRYCMTACPFEARSFNWNTPRPGPSTSTYPSRTAGVVEKCTLCVERIDRGQPPLCVETCRDRGAEALTFGDLRDATSPLRQLLATRRVLRRRPGLGTEPSIFYVEGRS